MNLHEYESMKPDARYEMNCELFKTVRKLERMSLRAVESETGVSACTASRLEHGKKVDVIAYIALMMWATLHNRNIARTADLMNSTSPRKMARIVNRLVKNYPLLTAVSLDK